MQLQSEENRVFVADGMEKVVAEVTFPAVGEGLVDINHTFVDESLRGQGVAGQMMQAVADQLRQQGKKAVLSCSYAVKWFEKHPEYADIKSPVES
ncbi:MAG: GNAT family N-acetyltransferase [Ethanoligenens sp.]